MIDETTKSLVSLALAEDAGRGDVTSLATIEPDAVAEAVLIAKQATVFCGTEIAEFVLSCVDNQIKTESFVQDGDFRDAGAQLMQFTGNARALLMAERTVLNFLQRLCGTATLTRKFVDAVEGTKTKIVDTRKTTPGWRSLQKFAVRIGGGGNHRADLAGGVLIKENHIASCGSVREAVRRAKKTAPHSLRIEIEVTSLAQLDEALAAGCDVVLLDNMSMAQMKESVSQARAAGVLCEASGGVSLETVKEIAQTGVDFISVGALTHSAPAIDLSLLFAVR